MTCTSTPNSPISTERERERDREKEREKEREIETEQAHLQEFDPGYSRNSGGQGLFASVYVTDIGLRSELTRTL